MISENKRDLQIQHSLKTRDKLDETLNRKQPGLAEEELERSGFSMLHHKKMLIGNPFLSKGILY